MNRFSNILTLVLGLQLLLVAALFWPSTDDGDNLANQALLQLASPEAINRIAIGDNENAVILSQQGDRWILPEYHSLPIDSARLSRLIQDLPALSRGWPVASSASATRRFQVANDSFQREVEYFIGEDSQGRIYLGTSPGFRKVHARSGKDDVVYAVEFNTFDVPAQAAEWLDKTLLQVSDIQFIDGLDYLLSLEGENWAGENGTVPEQAEVDKLVNALSSLRVTAAADIATASILEEMQAPPTLTVTTGDEIYEYRLFEIDEDRYIQRADIPVYFTLSAFDYDRLNDVNAASLFPAVDANPPPGAN